MDRKTVGHLMKLTKCIFSVSYTFSYFLFFSPTIPFMTGYININNLCPSDVQIISQDAIVSENWLKNMTTSQRYSKPRQMDPMTSERDLKALCKRPNLDCDVLARPYPGVLIENVVKSKQWIKKH